MKVSADQAKKLFDKGYISKSVYNKLCQKYANGGVVENPVSSQTPFNPISQIIDPAVGVPNQSVSPELQQKIDAAKVNTVEQASKAVPVEASPGKPDWMSEEGWATAPTAVKQAFLGQPQSPEPQAPMSAQAAEPAVSGAPSLEAQGLVKTAPPPIEPKVAATQAIAGEYDKGYNQIMSGISEEAKAGAEAAAKTSAAYTTALNDLQEWQQKQNVVEEQRKQRLDEQNQILQSKIDDYAKTSVVDPNRYWANKSTGQKIMAGIGIILGGVGRGGGNDALQVINNAINRDIEAQKAQIGSKATAVQLQNNIYSNMLNQFQDSRSAEQATRLAMLNMAEMKIKQASAASQGPMVKAQAMKAMGEIQNQKAKTMGELYQSVSNSPQMIAADDMTKRILQLPKDMQNEAFKELGEYRAIESNLKQLDRIYDQLVENTTLGKLASSPIQTKALLDKAEADLFPIVKSIVGEKMTDSDARILIKSQLPGFTDSTKTTGTKKGDLVMALQSKIPERAPRLTGMGIISTPKPLNLKRNE